MKGLILYLHWSSKSGPTTEIFVGGNYAVLVSAAATLASAALAERYANA